jgi:putative tributyrin esterase
VLVAAFLLAGCTRNEEKQPDHPRLTSDVVLHDLKFRSGALNRQMQYRVILPRDVTRKLPVVYLLHGNGGGFRDWSNYSDVSRFAQTSLILVMPQGDESYYVNAVQRPEDRYEDYIVQDLAADVEAKFPAAPGRSNRAIVGVSMGGFGAIKIALSHPDLFVFAGALSAAIDVPRRPLSLKRIPQYLAQSSIFGPWGSVARLRNDPFLLARMVQPAEAPYLYLSCGQAEGLLPANREFAAVLRQRHLQYEFHAVPGGHDWTQWNEQLPALFQGLEHVFHGELHDPGTHVGQDLTEGAGIQH